MTQRMTTSRHKLGIKHKWLQDRRCRRQGHQPNPTVSVQVPNGAYWPVCDRCGYGVEPDRSRA